MKLKLNRKILAQLGREFRLPAILSACWLVISWIKSTNFTLINGVNTFSTTFFLISWMSSQYFRVSKQNRTEGDLDSIQSNLQSILAELDKKTSALSAQMSGDGSYCQLSAGHVKRINDEIPEKLIINLNHHGIYPIYDVDLTFIILIKYKPGFEETPMFHKKIHIGTINKGGGKEIITIQCETIEEVIVSCITSTRIGVETNNMRGWRNGAQLEFAYKTERNGEQLYNYVPQNMVAELNWNNFRI